MTANMTSVRLSILNTMLAAFEAMTVEGSLTPYDAPTSDPYGIAFSTVELGPLSMNDQRKAYSLGLAVGPEKETFQMPFIMCFMTVNVELRATVNRGEGEPGVKIEELITVVKRLIGNNRQWNRQAIDTKVTGTEVDLITYADRSALGVVVCQVQYRYNVNDPRNPSPSDG
jgi:hypothetical protein